MYNICLSQMTKEKKWREESLVIITKKAVDLSVGTCTYNTLTQFSAELAKISTMYASMIFFCNLIGTVRFRCRKSTTFPANFIRLRREPENKAMYIAKHD